MEDVSLLFIGITIIFISTVELVLGVAVFVLINLEQGRVFVEGQSVSLKWPLGTQHSMFFTRSARAQVCRCGCAFKIS